MTKHILGLALVFSFLQLPLSASAATTTPAGLEGAREFSGEKFLEMQNKPGEVRLDFVLAPAKNSELKLSAPKPKKPLASQVKALPQTAQEMETEIQAAHERAFKVLDLGMTMAITAVGVVFGGLAGGIPGAVIGGGIAYGIWTAAKLTA